MAGPVLHLSFFPIILLFHVALLSFMNFIIIFNPVALVSSTETGFHGFYECLQSKLKKLSNNK